MMKSTWMQWGLAAVFCAAWMLCGGTPATAEVSADDAAQGWISLFDGETTYGWLAHGDADWQVRDGALVCESGSGGWIATTSQFRDFEMDFEARTSGEGNGALILRGALDGHPSENGSYVRYSEDMAEWTQVHLEVRRNVVQVNGMGEMPSGLNREGHIGFAYLGDGRLEIKNIKLRPLDMEPIFNGKNLDGWHIVPDRKSEFSVTDGVLNIKDGNGQIETEDVYRDFVLQLSVISNGEHLNSGVFLRGKKGTFWKGYESQIRNEWEGDDRTEPVDFGTGGLYAIQEARKVVSSDHEWFHKTVVCNDNHIAVWINGYQVTDFTDLRPPVDSGDAKVGFVSEAGTIHLQGHDPTTDLSFKDIRIQQYGK